MSLPRVLKWSILLPQVSDVAAALTIILPPIKLYIAVGENNFNSLQMFLNQHGSIFNPIFGQSLKIKHPASKIASLIIGVPKCMCLIFLFSSSHLLTAGYIFGSLWIYFSQDEFLSQFSSPFLISKIMNLLKKSIFR